jgi:hypothetical protein
MLFVAIIGSVFLPFVFPSSLDPTKTLLHQLSDSTTARGLITFLLAVSTVAIALFLTLWVVITPTDGQSSANFKERFAFGKELLTALIGILGTIIGFYFGSAEQNRNAPSGLAVVEMRIQPDKPKKSDEINLTGTIGGGRSPYSYTILFTPASVTTIRGQTADGQVSVKFKLPDDYDTSKPLEIELLATDTSDAVTHKHSTIAIAPQ